MNLLDYNTINFVYFKCTEWMECMTRRKWKETKPQPGTAGPGNRLGCCLVFSFPVGHPMSAGCTSPVADYPAKEVTWFVGISVPLARWEHGAFEVPFGLMKCLPVQ